MSDPEKVISFSNANATIDLHLAADTPIWQGTAPDTDDGTTWYGMTVWDADSGRTLGYVDFTGEMA